LCAFLVTGNISLVALFVKLFFINVEEIHTFDLKEINGEKRIT
jgi:hypothetical protein